MVISSVNNFKTSQMTSFGKSNKTASSYVAPQMMDAVEISKKTPKNSGLMHDIGKALKFLSLGAAGALLASCTMGGVTNGGNDQPVPPPPSGPTTPIPPVTKTPVEQTQDAVVSTFEVLNPQVKTAPTGKFEGFSYDMSGRHDDFAVTGADATTGKLTINHVSMDIDNPKDKVSEILTVSKIDNGGFKVTKPNGGIQEFISLGHFIQETDMKADGTNKLFYNLQKMVTQGDVSFTDLASHITTSIANFRIRK